MQSVSDEMFMLLHLDSFAIEIYQNIPVIQWIFWSSNKILFQTCDDVVYIKICFLWIIQIMRGSLTGGFSSCWNIYLRWFCFMFLKQPTSAFPPFWRKGSRAMAGAVFTVCKDFSFSNQASYC